MNPTHPNFDGHWIHERLAAALTEHRVGKPNLRSDVPGRIAFRRPVTRIGRDAANAIAQASYDDGYEAGRKSFERELISGARHTVRDGYNTVHRLLAITVWHHRVDDETRKDFITPTLADMRHGLERLNHVRELLHRANELLYAPLEWKPSIGWHWADSLAVDDLIAAITHASGEWEDAHLAARCAVAGRANEDEYGSHHPPSTRSPIGGAA